MDPGGPRWTGRWTGRQTSDKNPKIGPAASGSERCAGSGRRVPPENSVRRPCRAGAPLRCSCCPPHGVPPRENPLPSAGLSPGRPPRNDRHRVVGVLMLRTLQNPCGNRGHIGLQSGCPSGLGARWPSSSRFSRREATDVAPTPPRSSGTRHRMSDGPSLDGLGKSGDRRDGGRPDDSREGPHRPAHRAQCFSPSDPPSLAGLTHPDAPHCSSHCTPPRSDPADPARTSPGPPAAPFCRRV